MPSQGTLLQPNMKHVLVTGGNAGIGKALCKLLVTEHGCRVFMGSRSVQKGVAAVVDIETEAPATKGKIEVVELDTTDSASVASAAETVRAALGTENLYAVVNNAGTSPSREVRLNLTRNGYVSLQVVSEISSPVMFGWRRELTL